MSRGGGGGQRRPVGGGALGIGMLHLGEVTAVLDALAEAVTIRALDDRVVYANKAALDGLDMSSAAQLRDADPHALMQPWETLAEDGREIRMEDLPSVRLLRGEHPEPLVLRTVHRATGEEHWVMLKATPIRDAKGSIEAAVTIIEDVTVAKRAAMRMELLVRAGQILASSLDYQQTLRNVTYLAVPQIADWCAVDLFGSEGGRESVAVAHKDPAKLQMAERLRSYEPERLDPNQGLGKVKRTGQPELFTEIPDELLVAAAVDPEHLRLLREVGMRSVLIVPMRARGATIGALSLVTAESGRGFDGDDLEFAGQIADRAALAVENARLYTERTRIARTLQTGLLPDELPAVPGWQLAAFYQPAAPDSDVGGDFYDIWPAQDDWLMMIGDVTGKGVEAASLTSLVRHTAWEASEFDPRPASVLARVDAALKRRGRLAICTALCVRIRGSRCSLAAGGHPLPLHLSGQGVEVVGQPGTLLGGLPRPHWSEDEFELRAGESLVAVTDGVTDTLGVGRERYGAGRLRETLSRATGESPETIRDLVVESLADFQLGEQADDTALLVLQYVG